MIDSLKKLNIILKRERKINLINKNIGVELLRMLLCFWIVTCHTCDFKNKNLVKIINSGFHVPSFMIISYFFFYKNLYNRNIQKIKSRFERLLLPYIIWPVLILFFNNILLYFNQQSIFEQKLTLKDLMLSFIFGRHINKIFWFQFDLIFISLFFCIISFIFNKKLLIILNSLLILCYILQYSGINYIFFNYYQEHNFRNIGSLVEMIPFNVTGIILYYLNIINKLKNKKLYAISICIIIIFSLLKFHIFENIGGFRYPGIKYNIGGITLFILFSVLHIEQIKDNNIKKIILIITNYTGGIYYLHGIFFLYLKKRLILFRSKNFKGTIIIYLLNYTFCLIGYKFFHKTKYKNLFI